MKSNCCGADVVIGGGETHYYCCIKCGEACDTHDPVVKELQARLDSARKAFPAFTAPARPLKSGCIGQCVGAESWRLDYTGHDKPLVLDAFEGVVVF